MPARAEETEHAVEEGVQIVEQVAPVALTGEDGRLEAVRLVRMNQGELGESGRRRPVPIPGSEFTVPAEVAVVAIGNDPNPVLRRVTPDLEHTDRGTLVVDEETGRTSKPGVWAGGDIVTGGATVILAMGAGRRAARDIDAHLTARTTTGARTAG
jgi:glutamate synthase (NADPH/NADH) small chain